MLTKTTAVLFLICFEQIREVKETSLSGNQEKAEMEKRRLIWKVEGSAGEEVKRGEAVDAEKLVVELVPMEIRTLLIKFDDQIEMVGDKEQQHRL
jgi:alpha-mannosidase